MRYKAIVLKRYPNARPIVISRYSDATPHYIAIFIGEKRLDYLPVPAFASRRTQQLAAQAWRRAYHFILRAQHAGTPMFPQRGKAA